MCHADALEPAYYFKRFNCGALVRMVTANTRALLLALDCSLRNRDATKSAYRTDLATSEGSSIDVWNATTRGASSPDLLVTGFASSDDPREPGEASE